MNQPHANWKQQQPIILNTVIKASFKIATEIFRIFKTQKKMEIKQQVEVIIF